MTLIGVNRTGVVHCIGLTQKNLEKTIKQIFITKKNIGGIIKMFQILLLQSHYSVFTIFKYISQPRTCQL